MARVVAITTARQEKDARIRMTDWVVDLLLERRTLLDNLAEWERVAAARQAADDEAIQRWRAAHDAVRHQDFPAHVDLVEWLLKEMA